jgi:hypothetical protein
MKFQITGQDWTILSGTWRVPKGTVIDSGSDDVWSVRARGQTIPFSATPLDVEAHEAQLKAYPDAKHLLSGAWEDK